jgi:hypothetical protein
MRNLMPLAPACLRWAGNKGAVQVQFRKVTPTYLSGEIPFLASLHSRNWERTAVAAIRRVPRPAPKTANRSARRPYL